MRRPSVSSLAEALSRSDAPVGPAEERIAIARPSFMMRALIGGFLVMGLLFLAAMLVLGARVSTLVAEMKADRLGREQRLREALPEEAVLRDLEASRRESLARPLAAGRIWQARCELLGRDGDWQGVVGTCVAVSLVSPDDLTAAARVLHAEALHRLGRHAEAGRALHGVDQAGLDEAGRGRAADLAARIWQAENPAGASVQRTPEQGRQPAAE